MSVYLFANDAKRRFSFEKFLWIPLDEIHFILKINKKDTNYYINEIFLFAKNCTNSWFFRIFGISSAVFSLVFSTKNIHFKSPIF